MIFFEIGLGPIPILIVSEMFDAKYVATGMSASLQINWFCNFVVGLLFPYTNEYLQEYSFVPFAIVLFLAFMFALIWLPETQGTTPEESQAQLIKKNGKQNHLLEVPSHGSNEGYGSVINSPEGSSMLFYVKQI